MMPSECNGVSSPSNKFLLEVLQDLENERRRRIELEATVRHLSKQQNSFSHTISDDESTEEMLDGAPSMTTRNKDLIEVNEDTISLMSETPSLDSSRLSEALLDSSMKRTDVALEEDGASAQQFLALKAERDGLMQMIDAMFDKNDQSNAVSVASASLAEGKPSIPLHVLHMLETTPWDPRARRHTSCIEEVFEWQYYSKRHGWTNEIKEFPNCFLKGVPRRRPTPTPIEVQSNPRYGLEQSDDLHGVGFVSAQQRKKKMTYQRGFINGGDSTQTPPLLQHDSSKGEQRSRISLGFSSGCVLTSHDCNVRYNLEDGFPMPNEGTWNWVGGWRVDSSECTVDCDFNGWTYADDVEDLALRKQSQCYDSPRPETKEERKEWETLIEGNPKHALAHGIIRPFRLRRWTRLRVLTSYPCIGEMSKQFLTLSAQNAGLSVSISKVSNQLLNTQVSLAEKEEKIACSRELLTQVERLQNVNQEKDNELRELQTKLSASEKRAREAEQRQRLSHSLQLVHKDRRPLDEVPHQNNIPRRLFKSASERISSSGTCAAVVRAETPPSPLSFLPKIVSNASANIVSRLPKVGGDSNNGVRALIIVDEDDHQEGSRGENVHTVDCDSGADEESLVPDSLSLGSSDESRWSQHFCCDTSSCSESQSADRDSHEKDDAKDVCLVPEVREAMSAKSPSPVGTFSLTPDEGDTVKIFADNRRNVTPELPSHKNFPGLPFMPFRCIVTDDGATVAVTPTCDES